jgi:DNA-directed RNA polymerase beta' subunit
VQEITEVRFGVYSAEEILKMSVSELTSTKRVGRNSVYDPRMGPTNSDYCETCGSDPLECPGHFGHITLNVPVVHPLFRKTVVSILKCICIDCNRCLLSVDHTKLRGLNMSLTRGKRFNYVKQIFRKVDICTRCGTPQPQYRNNTVDNTITATYTDLQKKKITIEKTAQSIFESFSKLTEEDLTILGFQERTKPSSFILTVLPVLPPTGRPFVKAAGNTCDDDLSNQYVEIIKVNKKLGVQQKKGQDACSVDVAKRLKLIQSLKFRISTTFNNSAGKAKHTTNGRPVKCIKTRISGKDGQMRGNIMGRRADQTARTVIGPDTTLKNSEMIIPREIAQHLTIPNRVTLLNIKELTRIVNTKKAARFVLRRQDGNTKIIKINLKHALYDKGTQLIEGDVCSRSTNGTQHTSIIGDNTNLSHKLLKEGLSRGDTVTRQGTELQLKYKKKRHFTLKQGDVVERCLRDGDIVILNRQPTLHKASMMAFSVLIKPGKTFRFNLACTKAFNADFDKLSVENSRPQKGVTC